MEAQMTQFITMGNTQRSSCHNILEKGLAWYGMEQKLQPVRETLANI